jgi:hypothetical protein
MVAAHAATMKGIGGWRFLLGMWPVGEYGKDEPLGVGAD